MSVEAYDPTTNAWTAKEHMPTARQSLTIGVAGRRLYAAGGLNSGGFLNTVLEYRRGVRPTAPIILLRTDTLS